MLAMTKSTKQEHKGLHKLRLRHLLSHPFKCRNTFIYRVREPIKKII